VRKDLIEIVQEIRSHKDIKHIAMTTNGIVLKHKIAKLKEAGLDSLNIRYRFYNYSLDTLVAAKFTFITRRLGFEAVLDVKYI
jgi:cyclic pyranopterin phosphate synthase